jgi:hypothetical protein
MKFQQYNKVIDVPKLGGILTSKYKDLSFNIGEENRNIFIEWNWKEENNGKVVPKTIEIMKTLRDNHIIPKRYNVCASLSRLELEY